MSSATLALATWHKDGRRQGITCLTDRKKGCNLLRYGISTGLSGGCHHGCHKPALASGLTPAFPGRVALQPHLLVAEGLEGLLQRLVEERGVAERVLPKKETEARGKGMSCLCCAPQLRHPFLACTFSDLLCAKHAVHMQLLGLLGCRCERRQPGRGARAAHLHILHVLVVQCDHAADEVVLRG